MGEVAEVAKFSGKLSKEGGSLNLCNRVNTPRQRCASSSNFDEDKSKVRDLDRSGIGVASDKVLVWGRLARII